MFDQVFSYVSHRLHAQESPHLPEHLFTSRRFVNPGSIAAVIVLDPWHINPELFRHVENKIKRLGCSYIHYSFAPRILTADETLKKFETFCRKIREEINVFCGQNAISQVTVIGISLSCVTVSLIADTNLLVMEMIMVVPGHSLAESMWYGLRMQHLRLAMAMNGMMLDVLQKKWEILAPATYLSALADKRIKVIVLRKDQIIPAYCVRLYVEQASINIKWLSIVENNFFSHYLSILYNIVIYQGTLLYKC